MPVQITARHTEVTPALREYVEKKWEKLMNHQEQEPEARIVLSIEKFRHKAEIIIHTNSGQITSRAETYDMYQSIDQVFDRVQRRLRESRDRTVAVKARRNPEGREVKRSGGPATPEAEAEPEQE